MSERVWQVLERLPLFHGLTSVWRSFAGFWILAPIVSVVGTAILIRTGLDDATRVWVIRVDPIEKFATEAFTLGMLWPIMAGLLVVRSGFFADHRERTAAGCAILQTVAVVGLMTAALKLATGRPPPRFSEASIWFPFHPSVQEGRMMWPSGHTSENVSALAAIAAFYGRRWFTFAAALAALATTLAMVLGHYHWVSDVLAGALLGAPVGRHVGRTMRAWVDSATKSEPVTKGETPPVS